MQVYMQTATKLILIETKYVSEELCYPCERKLVFRDHSEFYNDFHSCSVVTCRMIKRNTRRIHVKTQVGR